jgi:hypothetical protein
MRECECECVSVSVCVCVCVCVRDIHTYLHNEGVPTTQSCVLHC